MDRDGRGGLAKIIHLSAIAFNDRRGRDVRVPLHTERARRDAAETHKQEPELNER